MTVLTVDEIDRELATRIGEVAAISATLMELDNHPGNEHVCRYPPTGVTAQRWTVIEASIGQLWEDLGRLTSILDSARAVRARRSKLDEEDRVELTRLLRERPLEVSRQRIPLSQRALTSPGEAIEYVGLVDLTDRMRVAYPAVVEFLDAVEKINALIVSRLAPLQRRLDDAGVAGHPQIADLLRVSATDPLSLTPDDIEERARVIAADVERQSVDLAEMSALQMNWPAAVAAMTVRIDALREASLRAARVRADVESTVVSGPLPTHADAVPGLRAELTAMLTPDPQRLRSLSLRVDAALQIAREDEQLAKGLLDRRSELTGRLSAYQAKAARLGLGEDSELLASGQIAAGLLSRRPCDLRAVTRAIVDFQQLIVDKRGNSR